MMSAGARRCPVAVTSAPSVRHTSTYVNVMRPAMPQAAWSEKRERHYAIVEDQLGRLRGLTG